MKYINILPRNKYPWLTTLYSMILDMKPKTIIEYGTEHGGTAIVMGLALKELYETEQHKGIVYTFDTFEAQSKGEIGSCPNYNVAVDHVAHYGLQEYIKVDRGDFFEFGLITSPIGMVFHSHRSIGFFDFGVCGASF